MVCRTATQTLKVPDETICMYVCMYVGLFHGLHCHRERVLGVIQPNDSFLDGFPCQHSECYEYFLCCSHPTAQP